jgi:1,4-alpha-glucan branching enzyme
MVIPDATLLGDTDLHLFNEGTHLRLWEKLGEHPETVRGVRARTSPCGRPGRNA